MCQNMGNKFMTIMSRYFKIAWSSKDLFDNWFSAGLKYFVFYKLLKKRIYIDVMCKDGFALRISPEAFGALISGYYDSVFTKLSCVEKEKILIDDFPVPLHELEVSGTNAIIAVKYGWKFNENYKCWVKDGIKFKHARDILPDVFIHGEYESLEVSGKNVIDIGATYGDSTIYFISRGAEKVIAVEPCPHMYKELVENLKLNNLLDRVVPINAALGSKSGKNIIKCPGGKAVVNVITLKDIKNIMDKLGIDSAVLKMDCEGCEYDVILNDYESVRMFNEIYFEYHMHISKMPVEILLEKLSSDFECKIVSDEKFYKRHPEGKSLGLVRCTKKHL